MDRYAERIKLYGVTQRDRLVTGLKNDILTKAPNNPSYKKVKLNGVETSMVIDSGTQPYYKTFASLPGEKVLMGDYVEWANQTWIVYSADCDDESYIDGDLRQCNHTMYWQNSKGDIVSRKVWVQNASAYNNGETGNSYITIETNQFMVYMPYDEESVELRRKLNEKDYRINMTRDENVCVPYALTRFDDINYAYGEKGILNLILTQSQYDSLNDRQVTLDSGETVWICDYDEPKDEEADNEPAVLFAEISGGDFLRCGRAKTWAVSFSDRDGNAIEDYDFEFNIVSDFNVAQTVNENKIQLKVSDEDYIGSSFLMEIIVDGAVLRKLDITVIEGF